MNTTSTAATATSLLPTGTTVMTVNWHTTSTWLITRTLYAPTGTESEISLTPTNSAASSSKSQTPPAVALVFFGITVLFLALGVARCIFLRKKNRRRIPKIKNRTPSRRPFIQRFTQIGVPDTTAVAREELELGSHQYRSEELGRLVPDTGSTGMGPSRASEEGAMIQVDEAEETGLSEPPPAYFSAENGPAPPNYRNLV